jgi:hypothetical protein
VPIRIVRGAPGVRLADHDRADKDRGMTLPRRDSTTHLIGLLLGTENDWPTAFQTLTKRLDPISYRGEAHHVDTERITIEPFDLRAPVRHDVVIDRLAWWYYHPREWLKKAALVNDTYLLTPCWSRTRIRSTTRSGPTPPSGTTCRSTWTRWPPGSGIRCS